jgi:hypothetical protein
MANLLVLDLKLKRPKPFTSKNNFETMMTMNSLNPGRFTPESESIRPA